MCADLVVHVVALTVIDVTVLVSFRSPNLVSPRFLNAHDLPDDGSDTRSNSNLFFMTEDIVDMMREIRTLIADGERVIEKQKRWTHTWCPRTIFDCLSGNPIVFWSDTEGRNMSLLKVP